MADKQACKLFGVTVLFIMKYNFYIISKQFTVDTRWHNVANVVYKINNIKRTGPKTLPCVPKYITGR